MWCQLIIGIVIMIVFVILSFFANVWYTLGMSSVSQYAASLLFREFFVIVIAIGMISVIALIIFSMSGMRCNVVSQPVSIVVKNL